MAGQIRIYAAAPAAIPDQLPAQPGDCELTNTSDALPKTS